MSQILRSVALGKVNIVCLFSIFFQILHNHVPGVNGYHCSNFRLETLSTSFVKLRDFI